MREERHRGEPQNLRMISNAQWISLRAMISETWHDLLAEGFQQLFRLKANWPCHQLGNSMGSVSQRLVLLFSIRIVD